MKERLDIILVVKLSQLTPESKGYYYGGNVFVNGQKETKAGTSFGDTVEIESGKP